MVAAEYIYVNIWTWRILTIANALFVVSAIHRWSRRG